MKTSGNDEASDRAWRAAQILAQSAVAPHFMVELTRRCSEDSDELRFSGWMPQSIAQVRLNS
jgi:hypothetical protein